MKVTRIALVMIVGALLLAWAAPAMAADNGKVNGDVNATAHLSLTLQGTGLHYGSPAFNAAGVAEINSTKTVLTNSGDVQSGLFIKGDGPAKASGKEAYWAMDGTQNTDSFAWKFANTDLGTVSVQSDAASDLGSLGYQDSKDFSSVIDMPKFSTQIGTYEWSATAWVTAPN
ncbi:MAG: hypothetical protein WCP28_12575 [Actinomycetes bacterium]